MKRKELKKTLKQCVKIYARLGNIAESSFDKEFYAGKLHSYKHILWLLEESNDDIIL